MSIIKRVRFTHPFNIHTTEFILCECFPAADCWPLTSCEPTQFFRSDNRTSVCQLVDLCRFESIELQYVVTKELHY
jgi:hypothetical protein